jgi:Coenzyme PQQ synthesis protein D (PqqD)
MTLCLRKKDLEWRDIDNEIVALDAQGAVYLAVRGAGVFLWRLLADSSTRDGLVEALVETYQIDAARAGDDVDEFLTTLNDRGLLAL